MHGTYLRQEECAVLLVVLPEEIPHYRGPVHQGSGRPFRADWNTQGGPNSDITKTNKRALYCSQCKLASPVSEYNKSAKRWRCF